MVELIVRGDTWPFVTIVVPTLNEEAYIHECLLAMSNQDYPGAFEILVLDAGSRDATSSIVTEMARADRRIRLYPNIDRLQAAACNRAASLAAPEASVLVRADAHSGYPVDFVTTCVNDLAAHNATSVVVPMVAVGRTPTQLTIAALQNSWLGNGGSAHRRGGVSGFVEHGHHAAFDLAFFRSVGGYDETFSHNEDAELDHRMIAAGGRIWMSGATSVTYFPRGSLRALARQYVNHGGGRARMLLTHRVKPRLRQMLPLAFLVGSLGGVVLAPLSLWFLAAPGSYALIATLAGSHILRRAGLKWTPSVGLLAMCSHLSWAVGFVRGVAIFRSQQRNAKHQVVTAS